MKNEKLEKTNNLTSVVGLTEGWSDYDSGDELGAEYSNDVSDVMIMKDPAQSFGECIGGQWG